eukprot:1195127-Prorocentrum_minimum.AAC.7
MPLNVRAAAKPGRFQFVEADLGNYHEVERIFRATEVDLVIHFAAVAYVVSKTLVRIGTRIEIHVSSRLAPVPYRVSHDAASNGGSPVQWEFLRDPTPSLATRARSA